LHEEEGDSLCWSKNVHIENYIVKLGYQAIVEIEFIGERKWWWSIIWGMHASLKMKVLIWPVSQGQTLNVGKLSKKRLGGEK
jgi:hypothetical protein